MSEKYWTEDLVKSSERVRDAGEVFTPFNIIEDMLDLLPPETWSFGPSKTFLEPSCGNGRFLVVVLYRKFAVLEEVLKSELTQQVKAAYALEALSSIYGIDISEDNILGHEDQDNDGARKRVLDHFQHLCEDHFDSEIQAAIRAASEWIVDHNILVGNMLDMDSSGKPTNRDLMPIPEYLWDAASDFVEVRFQSWGDLEEENRAKGDGMLDIFGLSESVSHWKGPSVGLAKAPRVSWKPKGTIPRGTR